MRKLRISCDVCGNEYFMTNVVDKKIEKTKIQIIFTTDQTEGRTRPHYLSMEGLDICDSCHRRVLKGNVLYGSGAQGHNKYWFKVSPEEAGNER